MGKIVNRTHGDIEKKRDRQLSLFIAGYYVLTGLNISIKVGFGVSDAIASAMSNAVAALMVLGLLFSLRAMIKRAGLLFLLSETIAFVLYFFSYALDNSFSFSFLLSMAMWTMGICIPLGIAARSVSDKKILIHYLVTASIIVTLPLCLAMLNLNNRNQSYSMSCAYSLLLPVLLFFYHFFNEKKKVYLILGLACTGVITFFGNRGALVCILIYLLIKSIFLNTKIISKILNTLLFLLAIYIIAVDQSIVIAAFEAITQIFGIKSYTATRIISSSFFQSDARQDLWVQYAEKIMEKPFLGWGVAGGWVSPEYYPHNILFEFYLSFGCIFGTLISILYLRFYVKSFTCKDAGYRELLVIYAICCASLFVSGTFLNTPKVFIFVFLCYGRKRHALDKIRFNI